MAWRRAPTLFRTLERSQAGTVFGAILERWDAVAILAALVLLATTAIKTVAFETAEHGSQWQSGRAAAKVATGTPSKTRPTGKSVARLRRQQGLSVAQFAAQLGVSSATVYRWETTQGPLNLQARLLNALAALQQRAKKGVV